MTRIARIAALAALIGGGGAAGAAAAQEGPMAGPMTGDMPRPMMGPMIGRGGLDFAAIDTDGNGSLSRAELVARATERLGRADASGDGILERAEIVAAMPGPHGGLVNLFAPDPGEAFADRMLAMMGATETGRVSITDLAGQRVNFLFAVVDTDRDAAISQAEAEAMRDTRHGGMERHGRPHRMHRSGPEGDDRDGPQDRG